jgi:hypothetical protein
MGFITPPMYNAVYYVYKTGSLLELIPTVISAQFLNICNPLHQQLVTVHTHAHAHAIFIHQSHSP